MTQSALERFGITPAKLAEIRTLREQALANPRVQHAIHQAKVQIPVRLEQGGWRQIQTAADGAGAWVLKKRGLRLIHSIDLVDDDVWAHVSLSRADRTMPTWEQLRDAWRRCHPSTVGIVVIPPAGEHVNLAEVAHAWGNLDRRTVPDLTHGLGTI